MPNFTDTEGRKWQVNLDIFSLKQIKSEVGVDLLDSLGSKDSSNFFIRMQTDPVIFFDALYVVCRKQCEERSLSDEDFGRLFTDGKMIEKAMEAFTESVVNFCRPGQAAMIRKTVNLQNQVMSLGLEKIGEKLDQISAEDIVNDALREKLSGQPFTAPLQS